MTEKKYLKWYNKVGYGSGDIAGNVIYAFLSSFVMIYLTNTVGMRPGIIGTLMMMARLFDGITDVFFGSLIDRTHSKMGKARPWMLFPYIGNAILLIMIFAIPQSWGDGIKYAYFFITYTLLNAVFYTANNIAYSALTALVTKNSSERVQMGSIRFIFAFGTSMAIQAVTVGAVSYFGGGAVGWRTVAIIYAIIGLVVNTISVLSVKELPEEELEDDANAEGGETQEKYTLVQAFKLLIKNKFFLMICGTYILTQVYTAMINTGIYFMTYVLGDANLLGRFSFAINLPMVIALLLVPSLVKRAGGMYKINLGGYALATVARALVIVGGYIGNIPMMLAFSAIASIGMSPLQGDLNALIASCSEYTYKLTHKRIDGTMYSCTSLGVKLGGGVGTALTGWLLEASGFASEAAVQSGSCLNMMGIMYLWIPMIINLVIMLIQSRLKVEEANEQLLAEKQS